VEISQCGIHRFYTSPSIISFTKSQDQVGLLRSAHAKDDKCTHNFSYKSTKKV